MIVKHLVDDDMAVEEFKNRAAVIKKGFQKILKTLSIFLSTDENVVLSALLDYANHRFAVFVARGGHDPPTS